jgi:putative C-S lyase
MYDFTTLINQDRSDSSKWAAMMRTAPQAGPDIVPLSVADMEFDIAPEIRQGLLEYLKNVIPGYGNLTPSYYRAVSGWMKKRHGWEVQDEWIVPSSGVVPALFHCVEAYSEPGEGVILMPPVYAPFYRAVTLNHRKTAPCGLVIRNGRYEMDFETLEKLLDDPANRVLLFCSPHNPVGRVWEREELEQLAFLCRKKNVVIISDEIHHDLVLEGPGHLVFSSFDGMAEKTVVCTAPSKTFNLAGFQTSNIIIENPLLRKKYIDAARRRSAGFEINIMGPKACELAYTCGEAWLEELLAVLRENRDFTETFIAGRIGGIKIFKTQGTYLQWWDCRGLGMEHGELERFMTQKARLFLNEGYVFGDEGRGFERINLACPRSVLEKALTRLEEALTKPGKNNPE